MAHPTIGGDGGEEAQHVRPHGALPRRPARQLEGGGPQARQGGGRADKAIGEWGRPKSAITHLIFCTTSGVDMPSADYQLTKLLWLSPFVCCTMLYLQGCCGVATVIRLAKDLAENNAGARVLPVCSQMTSIIFRGPFDTHIDNLVVQALIGDGASAVIVGADPDLAVE